MLIQQFSVMNRKTILISVQKAKYCSQFSNQCVYVMLEVKTITQPDSKYSLYAYAIYQMNVKRFNTGSQL